MCRTCSAPTRTPRPSPAVRRCGISQSGTTSSGGGSGRSRWQRSAGTWPWAADPPAAPARTRLPSRTCTGSRDIWWRSASRPLRWSASWCTATGRGRRSDGCMEACGCSSPSERCRSKCRSPTSCECCTPQVSTIPPTAWFASSPRRRKRLRAASSDPTWTRSGAILPCWKLSEKFKV